MSIENNEEKKNLSFWNIILLILFWWVKAIIFIFKCIFEGFLSSDNESTKKSASTKNNTKQKKKGKMTAYDILLARGYSEKEASRVIRNCQRDLEMAMDDGAMEELEDIVVEDLGVDSSHVEELI